MSLSFPNPQFQTLCDSHTPVSRMFQSIFLPFLAEIKVICQSTPHSPPLGRKRAVCQLCRRPKAVVGTLNKRLLFAYAVRHLRSKTNPQSPTIPMFTIFTVHKPTFALWQHIQECSKSIPVSPRQGGVRIVLSLSYPEMSLRPPCAHLAANQYV